MARKSYRENSDLVEFAQDIYEVLGMNTDFITQEQFFEKHVAKDHDFMVIDEGDKQIIDFDNYTITITKKPW